MENKVVNKYQDLTDEQQQVINHKSGNLLVSASAGSGKTKVLISKIVDIVLNKFATLKQLLVVTFTNDASAEMKIRLAGELQSSNDAFLREQLDDLTNCDILTFDKFYVRSSHNYLPVYIIRNRNFITYSNSTQSNFNLFVK